MEDPQQTLFTCISCTIAFLSADDQRAHYRSDHHRYNMKRRVAGLPPISVTLFNQRVIERKTETAITTSAKSMTCDICSKVYTTENAYKSHLQSKKHRDRELHGPPPKKEKAAPAPATEEVTQPMEVESYQPPAPAAPPAPVASPSTPLDEDEEMELSIEAKIAAARARLSNLDCLFCPSTSPTFDENIEHMSNVHSFFIPDTEYLVDLPGLITYLGEKIAVGNVCIYCNEKSKSYRSIEAVRRHMDDKGHRKLAYEERDRLEYGDFYDFSSSYPDAEAYRLRKEKKKAKAEAKAAAIAEEEEWEDEDMDVEGDEGSDVEIVDVESSAEDDDDSDDEELGDQLTYGDSPFELVLSSGARIGHRSMKRYYAQSFTTVLKNTKAANSADPNSGAALVRRLVKDNRDGDGALVPAKGNWGAFGDGTVAVKARNRGEAKEAGRHVKEFRDMRRREEFKTKVGYRHNSQKHFRDPLLQ